MAHITDEINWALDRLVRVEEAVRDRWPNEFPDVRRHKVACIIRLLAADKIAEATIETGPL